MKIVICICILWLSCKVSMAQAPQKFYMRFGGNGYDVGYDVKQTLDNGYIITGSTSSFGQGNTDMYLVKLDSVGRKKFETSFGNYNNEIGKSVVQLLDSSYVVVGYTNSTGFGGYDIFLVKTDKHGNLVWQKTIGGSDWDFAYSLQATSDGGFIIAGTTYSYGHGNADGYVVKTDANGNVTWTKTYGGANDDEFKSVIETSAGGYALTGYTKSYNDLDSGDVWVFKLDAVGDSTWCKFYGGGKEDFGNEIIQHPSGEYYIAGATQSYGVGLLDGYLLKLDNAGVLLLHQEHGSPSYDEEFTSVVVEKRNSNFICFMEKEFFVGFNLQFRLIEWTTNLNYTNATDYGSVDDDEMYKIINTKDKGYACIGYTKGYGATNTDVYFLKSDSNLIGSTSIVSLKENILERNQIQIFPNPSSKETHIQSSLNIKEIKLYDCSGIEIYINESIKFIDEKHIVINTENIKNGLYFIKVNSRTQKLTVFH